MEEEKPKPDPLDFTIGLVYAIFVILGIGIIVQTAPELNHISTNLNSTNILVHNLTKQYPQLTSSNMSNLNVNGLALANNPVPLNIFEEYSLYQQSSITQFSLLIIVLLFLMLGLGITLFGLNKVSYLVNFIIDVIKSKFKKGVN